ncbi:ArsR/SmtB family transcription factor [Desulfallas thermosapovorans]|uniref:ArsR family transcriptional regulator n=1 Tax=Desulfallas thermosapovorans DSM 6562 TaxID=1121431 RepID=A0A5S4ZPP0_9FIRM|nr:metalloregulator ArsR/SmtB family transcription factor [Desulfallas thermosapovorans]TYO94677.1 ArsR family transcriptional regulator [Desulfallas thermosapovorans DSM 6562]
MKETSKYEEPARLLKALAHPTRLCIVAGLINDSCNVNKMKECLELPQSTVSQQLAILRAQGIVDGERHGTEVFYKVANEQVKEIVKVLLGEDVINFKQV